MLEYIRSSAQSFGVKIAFGLIILVFVFWGVGNFNDRDYTNVVAVVNGQPILAMEFEKAYQSTEDFILRNNPGITREQLARQHLGRQVLRELIEETLLSQEARRAGIDVSPLEMRSHAETIPAFQNSEGRFDPDAYRRFLAARRMNPAQYEQELSKQLLQEKMFRLVTAPVWVDSDEAMRRFNFLRERREIAYIFFPVSRYVEKIKVSDQQIEDWYKEHKADFTIPPKQNIMYIQFRPEDLVDKASIAREELENWYNANTSRFQLPEQVKVSHILAPLPENPGDEEIASAREKLLNIRKEFDKGIPFAQLADLYNPDGAAEKGGELGWISRGQTVAPFEKAAFSAKPGVLTDIVQTPFGLHILLVEEKKAASQKSFEDVKDEVSHALAVEKGSDKLHDVLDALIEDNIMDKPLAESAKRFGLNARETGLLSKDELISTLHLTPGDADILFAVQPGTALDVALASGDSYIIARSLKSEPSSIQSLADVKTEIDKLLVQELALKESLQAAQEVLDEVKDKPLNRKEDQKFDIKTDVIVSREGSVADFLPDSTLLTDIFETHPGHWLPEVHAVARASENGALLVYVDKVLPANEDDFAEMEQILMNASLRQRQDALFSLFLGKLTNGAKIEITNSALIDRQPQ